MKNRIVKKYLRIIFWLFVGRLSVVGTFLFLVEERRNLSLPSMSWLPSHVTRLRRRPWRPERYEPRDEVLIKPQMSGIISEC